MTRVQDVSFDAPAARVAGLVRNAAETVMAMWPLGSFIAANPARIMERKPFAEAVAEVGSRLGGRGLLPPSDYRRWAETGLIHRDAVRAAFDRRVDTTGTASIIKVGGALVPAWQLQWLGHFEPAVTGGAGVRDGSEEALLADAKTAAERLPRDGRDGAGTTTGAERDDDAMARSVDKLLARWCAAYIDTGQALWPMPYRDLGLWAAWRKLAAFDPALDRKARRALEEFIEALPLTPEAAIHCCLDWLRIDEAAWQETLERHLLRLPGWASYLKWRAEQASAGSPEAAVLSDYLAIRLAYTTALRRQAMPVPVVPAADKAGTTAHAARIDAVAAALAGLARNGLIDPASLGALSAAEVSAVNAALEAFTETEQSLIWLEAHEETYRSGLLSSIGAALPADDDEPAPAGDDGDRAFGQLVFCIDVRSEPFRRNLERIGRYETLGFAGFFGVPVQYTAYADATSLDVCPALLKPRYRVADRPSTACAERGGHHRHGKDRLRQLKKVGSGLKGGIAACFGFVEAVGALFAAPFIGKTFWPRAYIGARRRLAERLAPPVTFVPDLEPRVPAADGGHTHGLPYGLGQDERVFFAEAALSAMGLTAGFARLVAMVGHSGLTENNPYAAALDCGACGGNPGGPSARILAAVLNEPTVRTALAERGIAIPDDTLFLAGEHNTTTDRITIYGVDEVAETHREDLARLERDLAEARRRNCEERRARLTLAGAAATDARDHALERATDWAQVRPEWGLARNAAFLIGPRTMTDRLNLEGRTFLHSYDWTIDDGGKALEVILTAPMVVAEWINTQYYFSTVDNDRFGSGSKVTHNVVGQIGVMQGNASDLQIGLPQQSVMVAHGEPYHEPLRLMTVCLAPVTRVVDIIERNPILQQLFDHEWVALVVIEPSSRRFLRYRPGGKWQDVTPGQGEAVSPTPALSVREREVA